MTTRVRVLHGVSLGIAGAFILVLQRRQWFFFDEWAFLSPDRVGLMEPHVGHWSTSPMLVYGTLVDTVGLNSYWPYAVLVTAIHLAIVHLVWRLSLLVGAQPVLATALAAMLAVLGAGSENILWAFQIGFLGAVALGLTALLLASSATLTRTRWGVVTAVSLWSLTWSGTAIPLVIATGFVLWRRHGVPKAVAFVAVTAAVYLAWYASFALGSGNNPDTGGLDPHKLVVSMPLFLGVMVVYGIGSLFPLIGVGVVALGALVTWWARMVRRRSVPHALLPALALSLAAVVFALMSAYSRAEFAIGAGRSSRYVYMLTVLLLPVTAAALSQLALRWTRGLLVTVVAVAALALYQGSVLARHAQDQAATEQGSRALLAAALAVHDDHPELVDPATKPDPRWAPDLTMAALIELDSEGLAEIGGYSPEDLDQASANIIPAAAAP